MQIRSKTGQNSPFLDTKNHLSSCIRTQDGVKNGVNLRMKIREVAKIKEM